MGASHWNGRLEERRMVGGNEMEGSRTISPREGRIDSIYNLNRREG